METAVLPTAATRAAERADWIPIPKVTLTDDQSGVLLFFQRQANRFTGAEFADLCREFDRVALHNTVGREKIEQSYYQEEMRHTGATWKEICWKYNFTRPAPLPPPKSLGEAERLQIEADRAVAAAQLAADLAERERRNLESAATAATMHSNALASARNALEQAKAQLAENERQAVASWTGPSFKDRGIYYANIAALRAMVEDFPRVEQMLQTNAESAAAEYANLLEATVKA